MHYCEVELVGLTSDECGQPAGLKVEGQWYCPFHFDALERARARWADPDWIARQKRSVESEDFDEKDTAEY